MLTQQDIEIGFWRFFPEDFLAPSKIEDVEIFTAERMRIDLSLMNPLVRGLEPGRWSQLIRLWQGTLPRLRNVKYLYVDHQMNQAFFESICRMDNLEGLYIKWSKVRNLQPIHDCRSLKHLRFGSTPGLKSIDGLETAQSLITLELENFKGCVDFSPLFGLKNLEILNIVFGGRITSLEGIQRLSRLRALTLGATVLDKNPKPIESLSNLEKLNVASTLWPKTDYTRLRGCFPKLKYGAMAERIFGTNADG